MCLAADPDLKTLLVKGATGVGKTSLVRAVSSEIAGKAPIVIPSGCSEEQLFGGLDAESTMATGRAVARKGILYDAGDGFVCMDDVNLADRRSVHALLDCISSGRVRIERDSVSASYPIRASMVGMMNIHESRLPPGISDRFDMCVTIPAPRDADFRVDVIKGNIGPSGYEAEGFRGTVLKAREYIPLIPIPDDVVEEIAEACSDLGVEGHRGGIACARAARALAALDGRRSISEDDIRTAMLLCLAHRRTSRREMRNEEVVNFYGDSHMKRFIHDDRKQVSEGQSGSDVPTQVQGDCPVTCSEGDPIGECEEVVPGIGEMFESIDLIEECHGLIEQDAVQKRRSMKDESREGRCVSFRPMTEGGDLHIDATIRHAAPFQRGRGRTDRMLLERSDLMEKVRERKRTCMFLFMVDNSGSLVIRGRMRAVKASILSMLATHYVRRDSVGIMTFNEENVGMALLPTRSVGSVRNVLDSLSVGKKTPLTEAIAYADRYVSEYVRKHPSDSCYLILMTDAKANIAMNPGMDPFEESLEMARAIVSHPEHWIVVDTAANPEGRTKALVLAEALRAPYYKMDSLKQVDGRGGREEGRHRMRSVRTDAEVRVRFRQEREDVGITRRQQRRVSRPE